MDSAEVGGDIFEQICQQNWSGEEERKARQQVTDARFGQALKQTHEMYPSQVA